MKKNDEFVVAIEDMSEDGAGIGRVDGYIWFIKDTVIGDVVRAGVMKMKKTYGFARLIEVVEPSKDRVEPRCPVARQCGGCQLQMMDYEAQLRFKERKIYNNLKRIGGMENLRLPGEECGSEDEGAGTGERAGADGRKIVRMEPIMGMEEPWRYRNKAQFPFGVSKDGRVITGFYAGRTHSIIENEDCLLGVEENREILRIVREFMEEFGVKPYDEEGHRGLVRHCLIRKGFATGEIMVCLVVNGRKVPKDEVLVERLRQVDGMTSISLCVNMLRTPCGTQRLMGLRTWSFLWGRRRKCCRGSLRRSRFMRT